MWTIRAAPVLRRCLLGMAGEVTLYRFVIPIAGSVPSALVLPGEDFTAVVLLALVLVAAGLIVVNYWGRKEVAHARL